MSNHIKAKFLGFNYAKIPKEAFLKMIPELIETLRNNLPRYDEQNVQEFKLNVSNDSFDAQQESLGKEISMVDAEGVWGVKIGNAGISLSVNGYVPYNEMLDYCSKLLKKVNPILKISYFSQVSIRNINLFKELSDEPNKFTDIQETKYWGRHDIGTLKSNFLCGGAATKHIYIANDFLSQLQLVSSIVMPNQSYIPQEEWNIWKLRGEVPALNEPYLLIDIAGTAFQAPINDPGKQNNLTKYNWDIVLKEYNALHDLVNKLYNDITKD